MNYYNYFTEIEEHFRRARNSGMFMMSPLDWALVEGWKEAGIPIEAVFKGIDRAFDKYHSRPRRASTVNSVAYCTQEVLGAAREIGTVQVASVAEQSTSPGLEHQTLASFFRDRACELRRLQKEGRAGCEVLGQTAATLEELMRDAESGELDDLETVEQRLTVLEDRMLGVATSMLTEDQLLAARREMEAQLKPYRRKMAAEQIGMLEQRYLRRRSLEALGLSRLSLFYVE